jgi:hypothetical protein
MTSPSLRARTRRELAHGALQPDADAVGLRRVDGEVVWYGRLRAFVIGATAL